MVLAIRRRLSEQVEELVERMKEALEFDENVLF